MAVQSLYILNRAGGLVYQKDFQPGLKKLSTNEYLVLAGTFHSIHAISSRVSPIPNSSGITKVEMSKFAMHCFQTLTGTKFLLITDIKQGAQGSGMSLMPDAIINKVYQLYADFVMKNPFYQMDMPVRCDLFDQNLTKYLNEIA
ncbi:uncharacterized protein SAPINGB_P001110 [Magnusiomyces paraingens]|uniref:Trafficking protein particle complex subunit n=1 Tax=Magnusiomyces paraingens TaxID=2606893 RepID=A0A5E8B419_9ASCO|nr:uncharacterized protein SAPINGB_P001110 [Saprochaete ingens]VVT46229.1 unnamed protein product [Saprochaete ingens]